MYSFIFPEYSNEIHEHRKPKDHTLPGPYIGDVHLNKYVLGLYSSFTFKPSKCYFVNKHTCFAWKMYNISTATEYTFSLYFFT